MDGFEGLLVLANRQNGKILIVTFWHSEEAMRSGEEASYWFRAFSAEAAGEEVTNVERYEVVFSVTMGAQHCQGSGSSPFGRTMAKIVTEDGIEIPLTPKR